MNARQKKAFDDAISALERFVDDKENEKKQKQDELVNALHETVNTLALVVEALALRELAK